MYFNLKQLLNSLRIRGWGVKNFDFWILENFGIEFLNAEKFLKYFGISENEFLSFIRNDKNSQKLSHYGEFPPENTY